MCACVRALICVHRFSEHTVYKAFSVASDSNLLQCTAPREKDFTQAIDTEITKVNDFADGLRKQLLARFQAAKEDHVAWIDAGSDEAGLVTLRAQMRECSEALQRFEDFINMNYLAFSKILKKHDKLSSCPCRAPYLLRIQRETFARQCLPELIKGISDLNASLSERSQPGTPEQTGGSAGPTGGGGEGAKKHGQFDSAQKGGTTFIRSTRKYWVATADVLKVKTFLLSHLPVYKFTDGVTDSDLVTSIYFDSPSRELYEGRLKKFDGAIALRVRWYGPAPSADDIVYMERKVHREDWFNEGRTSTKERFPIRACEVAPLLYGSLSPAELRERLLQRDFKGSVDDAVALAEEVQNLAVSKGLRPSLRTHYLRTAFQKTGDASVRISLDTDLCMSVEACDDDEWRRSAPLTSLAQLTHFPHAVLELKLQLVSSASGEPPEPPAWVSELLASGCLIGAPKFSKFVHGTARLYQRCNDGIGGKGGKGMPCDGNPPVREFPYWWGPDVRPMWDGDSMGGQTSRLGGGKKQGHANGQATAVTRENPLRRFFEGLVTCGDPGI